MPSKKNTTFLSRWYFRCLYNIVLKFIDLAIKHKNGDVRRLFSTFAIGDNAQFCQDGIVDIKFAVSIYNRQITGFVKNKSIGSFSCIFFNSGKNSILNRFDQFFAFFVQIAVCTETFLLQFFCCCFCGNNFFLTFDFGIFNKTLSC